MGQTTPADRTPGEFRQAGLQVSQELVRRDGPLVASTGHRHREREQVVRVESDVDLVQADETPGQKSGADEQDKGEGDLSDDEAAPYAARTAQRTPAPLQDFRSVTACGSGCRGQSDHDRAHRSDRQ